MGRNSRRSERDTELALVFYTPSNGPEGWRALLADPEKHWQTGYSAKALAYCWEEARGLPNSVQSALQGSPFCETEFLLGIPEHKVPLPPLSGRPSQNDLFVLAKVGGDRTAAEDSRPPGNAELVSIMVEGKVSESFDRLVVEWKQEMTSGKKERLEFLCRLLGLPLDGIDHIRYQLLHRTASALIEAARFCAPHALMLVHSFSQSYEHFVDYEAFGRILGVEVRKDAIVHVGQRGGKELYLCWVRGEEEFLTR